MLECLDTATAPLLLWLDEGCGCSIRVVPVEDSDSGSGCCCCPSVDRVMDEGKVALKVLENKWLADDVDSWCWDRLGICKPGPVYMAEAIGEESIRFGEDAVVWLLCEVC